MNISTVIVILAVVIMGVAIMFPRFRATIRWLGVIVFNIDASKPMPRPGVQIEDAQSRHGGLTARDDTGRGADVRKVAVDKDIQVSSTSPQEHDRPNSLPPA